MPDKTVVLEALVKLSEQLRTVNHGAQLTVASGVK